MIDGLDLDFPNFNPPASTGALAIEVAETVKLANVRISHPSAGANNNASLRLNGRVNAVLLDHVHTSGDVVVNDYVAASFTVDTGTDVLTAASHGLLDGDLVQLWNSTPANLPAPGVNYKLYWVVSATTNTFQVSDTKGGTAVNFTSAGSGTHSAYRVLHEFRARHCQFNKDYATTYAIYLPATPRVLNLEACVFHRANNTHLRVLEAIEPSSLRIVDGVFHNYGSGTVYVLSSFVTRSSILEWTGNLLVPLSSGSLATSSGERVHLFKLRAGCKNVYEDTTTPPATSTPVWHPGDTWVNLAAAAGAVCEWQNVAATGTAASWKAKATLAA